MNLLPKRLIWETPIFLSMFFVLFTGCIYKQELYKTTSSMSVIQGNGVQIENHSMNPSKDIFPPSVIGMVKNISSSKINFVDIKINFYDDNGISLGTSTVTVYNLIPDKIKNFTTYFFGSVISAKKVSKYNIEILEVVGGE